MKKKDRKQWLQFGLVSLQGIIAFLIVFWAGQYIGATWGAILFAILTLLIIVNNKW